MEKWETNKQRSVGHQHQHQSSVYDHFLEGFFLRIIRVPGGLEKGFMEILLMIFVKMWYMLLIFNTQTAFFIAYV